MSRDDASEIVYNAEMTALVLREIADHLANGEALNLAGEWKSDLRITSGNRVATGWGLRAWRKGWREANADAVQALRRIADLNDPRGSGVSR